MAKKYRICIVLAVCCLLCMLPQKIYAADKVYNLNKKNTVTISKGKTYAASGRYTWLKYKPSSDGYLILKAETPKKAAQKAKGYLAVYDKTRTKALSSKAIFYNTQNKQSIFWYKFFFGMKKDELYYIRVRSENTVTFTRTFAVVNDSAGTAMENAPDLLKNSKKTGLIPAGDLTADWYKIQLDQKQAIQLYYNAKTNGIFRISIYMGKQLIGRRNIYFSNKEIKITLSRRVNNSSQTEGLEPRTYYFKVEPANPISSGYYKLRWK